MAELDAAARDRLRDSSFAYIDHEGERHLPINDAAHVRNAISRFDQVEGVTNAERDRAWKRIVKAAKKFGVEVSERGWRELFHGKAPAKAKKSKKKTAAKSKKTTAKKTTKKTKSKK